MKVTELSGEHLGKYVVLETKHWKVSGVLHDIAHDSLWISNRSYCDPDASPIRGETISAVDVGGWEKRIERWENVEVTVTL